MNKRQLGMEKEKLACDYLEKEGYQILTCNYTTPFGEIDIIAKDRESLIFLEVKYRNSLSYGLPEEAVTPAKIKRIVRCAGYYFMEHKIQDGTQCRFDVVAIYKNDIKLIKNAFEA